MRISDWSSDVCSSDLFRRLQFIEHLRRARLAETPVETRDDVRGILHQADLAHRGEYRSAIGVVTDLLDDRWDQRIQCIGGRYGIGVSRRSSVTDTFGDDLDRSEEHTSELQSLMRISYAVFCLKKKTVKKRRERDM